MEVTYKASTTSLRYDPKVLEAEHFACALLMPKDEFTFLYNIGNSPKWLAERFCVPLSMVYKRIEQLGLRE